ncbi:MAG: hypothetical protein ACFCUQ_00785 [Kiloniellales bacterium]
MNKEMIKPFSWGVVLGGIAVTAVAFGAGWVVTSSSSESKIKAAWVDGQAAICSSLAQAHRAASGDTTDLTGYQARDARTQLATTFAVALPGKEAADPAVIRACSDMLSKRST